MGDDVLSDVVQTLELAVIERMPNAGYLMVTPPPAWLAGALDERQSLADAFPFLRHFLQFAGRAWHDGPPARAESGPFEAEVGDEQVLLTATAFCLGGRRILVLQRLVGDADPRHILQRAREHRLDHERLERAASAVHQPVAALARDVGALEALTLDGEADALVRALAASVETLQKAIAMLPAPPPKRRATDQA